MKMVRFNVCLSALAALAASANIMVGLGYSYYTATNLRMAVVQIILAFFLFVASIGRMRVSEPSAALRRSYSVAATFFYLYLALVIALNTF